eukprot:scaffold25416_cov30-Tisochrysis_lutea.AAC.2
MQMHRGRLHETCRFNSFEDGSQHRISSEPSFWVKEEIACKACPLGQQPRLWCGQKLECQSRHLDCQPVAKTACAQ